MVPMPSEDAVCVIGAFSRDSYVRCGRSYWMIVTCNERGVGRGGKLHTYFEIFFILSDCVNVCFHVDLEVMKLWDVFAVYSPT